MAQSVAVLTGDLVASSAAAPEDVDLAMQALAAAVARMGDWQIGMDPRFTRWRGDGWQVLVRDPVHGLRAALGLMACLRAARPGLSTRISLGLGGMDQPGTDSLADAGGSAFLTSGRALEQMRKPQRLVIGGTGMTPLHQGYGDLMAGLTRHWSAEQAEAIARALHPGRPTLSEIATELGISAQAVSYRLNAAFATEIRAGLLAWEEQFALDGTGGA